MKIAVVTDDEKKISAHFGRAEKYVVFTVEAGQVVTKDVIDKAHHKHGEHDDEHEQGHDLVEIQEPGQQKSGDQHGHGLKFAPIADVDVVISRGMGNGAHRNLEQRNIQVILTDIHMIDDAVQAVIDRTIIHNPKRLHQHGGGHHH